MKPAVFLDRDGTLNRERPDYVKHISELTILPRTDQAMRVLDTLDVFVFIVTNQPAVGSGRMSWSALEGIHAIFREQFTITKIYTCIHSHEVNCRCRKPRSGLIERAFEEYDISFGFMIGDSQSDMKLAQRTHLIPMQVGGQLPFAGALQYDNVLEAVEAVERCLSALG